MATKSQIKIKKAEKAIRKKSRRKYIVKPGLFSAATEPVAIVTSKTEFKGDSDLNPV